MLALAVWGPIVVVLVAGLVPWAAAATDNDAFATRALSVAVVLGVLATLPSWWFVRGWWGLVGGVMVKVACFLLLAPAGPGTLLLGHRELLAGFADDGLLYFWGVPPALLLVTALEGWPIALRGRGVAITETRVWARRRLLSALLLAGLVIAGGWWLGRVEFYLWRMGAHDHKPSSFALHRVGPGALPRIFRELDDLGERAVGEYRSDLVHVIADIRHDVVARQIGSPIVWESRAAWVEPDPAIVAAVGAALEREPDLEQRQRIAMWASDLDFNTVVHVFCGTFPRVPTATREAMIGHMLGTSGIVEVATRSYDAARRPAAHDPQYPWRDLPQPEIERVQGLMRERLACVPPLLVELLEAEAGSWPENRAPHWAIEAVDVLARLRPLAPELGPRLYVLLAQTRTGYFVTSALEKLGPTLVAGTRQTLQQAIAALFLALEPADTRRSLAYWVQREGKALDVDAAAMFCELLPRATPEQREAVFMLLDIGAPAGDRCVVAAIMTAYEQAALAAPHGRCGQGAPWLDSAGLWLRKEATNDPRVATWARELAPRVGDPCRRGALERLSVPPTR